MRRISKGVIFAGLFFLSLGVLWLGVIYKRAKAALPAEQQAIFQSQSPAVTYQELKTEMKTALARPSVIDRYVKETPVQSSQPPPKMYLKMFWLISVVEVVCCFLYILSGIFLLRLYPLARWCVFLTLYVDILFKGMMVTYMSYWAIPLESALRGKNILDSYFLSRLSGISAGLSSCVTGLKFYQPEGALFLFIYLVYLFANFYFFTRSSIKKQFIQ